MDLPHTDPLSLAPNSDTKIKPDSPISERFRLDIPQEEPWLRLPDEPIRQWRAFVVYRDLGAQRKLQFTADVANENINTVRNWEHNWEWKFRVEQFDRYVSRISAKQVMDEHAAMLTRHAGIAAALQSKALERLKTLDPSELSPRETLMFLKEAVAIERAARDAIKEGTSEPVSRENEDAVQDDIRVSGTWMGDIAAILSEAGALPSGVSIEDITNVIDGEVIHDSDND